MKTFECLLKALLISENEFSEVSGYFRKIDVTFINFWFFVTFKYIITCFLFVFTTRWNYIFFRSYIDTTTARMTPKMWKKDSSQNPAVVSCQRSLKKNKKKGIQLTTCQRVSRQRSLDQLLCTTYLTFKAF